MVTLERNILTGRLRRRAAHDCPTRKRSTCPNGDERTLAKQAQKALCSYTAFARLCLERARHVATLNTNQHQPMSLASSIILARLLRRTKYYLRKAMVCARLDAQLLDMSDDEWRDAGFSVPLGKPRIDTFFISDDQALVDTRFKKDELHWLIERVFQLEENVPVPQNSTRDTGKFYWFHREELVIYFLMKVSSKKTHLNMADDPRFGGSDNRWSRGYRWLVLYLKDKFFHLIGPDAIDMWVPGFPKFAHAIYDYVNKPKVRIAPNGDRRTVRWNHAGAPGRDEFNIASFLDGKVYECCRIGSGPAHPDEGARKIGAYLLQRAFYDGHSKKHAIRILSIYLPNGMTGAVYGPCSGREQDPTLLQWSGFDNRLRDLCVQHFGAHRLYASYGDAIFRGRYYCVRTRHEPIPALNYFLTPEEENEDDNMKSAREFIEHGYGFVSAKFPEVENKEFNKLLLDAELIYAKVHVFHFLSNVLVCLRGGSTCTGDRGFCLAPPSVEDYLNGTPCANLDD